jgi:phosphomannomutase
MASIITAARPAHPGGSQAVGHTPRSGRRKRVCRYARLAPGNPGRHEVLSRQSGADSRKPQAAESWLLLRASGTEPLLRIYAESGSRESVNALLEAGRNFAMGDEA